MKKLILLGLSLLVIIVFIAAILLGSLLYSGYRDRKDLLILMEAALPKNSLSIPYTKEDYMGINSELVNEYNSWYYRFGFEAPSFKAEDKELLYLYDNDPNYWCALIDIEREWKPRVREGFIYPDFNKTRIKKVVLADYDDLELIVLSDGKYKYVDGDIESWLTPEHTEVFIKYVENALHSERVSYICNKEYPDACFVRVYYEDYPMFENVGTIARSDDNKYYFTPRLFFNGWTECTGFLIDETAFPTIIMPEQQGQ